MPFINVKIAGTPLSAEQTSQVQRGVTSLMADVLLKNAALTGVLVEHVEAAGWSIGAEPVTRAAHVDATISAGTNTPEQKARFLAEVDRLLRQAIGAELPLVTYVVLHEVPKDSWGYGGVSQASRTAGQA